MAEINQISITALAAAATAVRFELETITVDVCVEIRTDGNKISNLSYQLLDHDIIALPVDRNIEDTYLKFVLPPAKTEGRKV